MRLNPEIQRNLWLEFSLHRLLAMPIVLMLIFFIASKLDGGSKMTQPFMMVETAGGALFFLLVKIWGGHKAAEAVIEEVNDNTWDFQKLSALSPWDLTVGKLFGGTSYAWYGGMIAYAVAVVAGSFHWSPYELFLFAASLLLDGLIVHATALFTSLIAIQNRNGAHNKMRVLPYHLAGLGVSSIFAASFFRNGGWLNDWHHPDNPITHLRLAWYGMDFDIIPFMIVTSAILLAWLVAGIYWQMRNQMRMRTGPWLWLGFVIFWLVYSAGFEPPAAHQPNKVIGCYNFSFKPYFPVHDRFSGRLDDRSLSSFSRRMARQKLRESFGNLPTLAVDVSHLSCPRCMDRRRQLEISGRHLRDCAAGFCLPRSGAVACFQI